MLKNYNQNWAEPLTHVDDVDIQIGLLFAETLFDNLTDGVSFFVKLQPNGSGAYKASFTEDNSIDWYDDRIQTGLGLRLTDSVLLIDTLFYRHGNTRASANQNRVSTGENFAVTQKDALTDMDICLCIQLTDNINYWIDPQVNYSGGVGFGFALNVVTYPLGNVTDLEDEILSIALLLSDNTLNNWSDTGFSKTLQVRLTENLADTLGIVYYDFSTKSDVNPLDPNFWTTYPQFINPLQVVGGVCEGTTVGNYSGMLYTERSFSNDQAVDVIIGTPAETLFLLLRGTIGGDCYECLVTQAAIFIASISRGIFGTSYQGPVNTGDRVSFVVQGTSLTAFLNGLVVATGTDSSIASGSPGLAVFNNVSIAEPTVSLFDAYSVNDLLNYTGLAHPLSVSLSDNTWLNILLDAISVTLGSSSLTEVLSDTMSLSDVVLLGYGNRVTDTLTLSDAMVFGLGFRETLTLSEDFDIGYGDQITDTLSLSDALVSSFGLRITDTQTLTDAVVSGFGLIISEALTLSDAAVVQYGYAIAETLTQTDASLSLLSIAEILSDTMSLSDVALLGYGYLSTDAMSLTDALASTIGYLQTDSLTLSDALVSLLSIAEILSDTMSLSDVLAGLGYGYLLPDTITLSDAATSTIGYLISETLTLTDGLGLGFALSDTVTQTDAVVVGYGDIISDALLLSDALLYLEGFRLADTLALSDAWGMGFGFAETLAFIDAYQLGFGYAETLPLTDTMLLFIGDIISDSMTLTDLMISSLGGGGTQQLADVLALSDAALMSIGYILAETITLLDQFVVGQLETLADTQSLSDAFGLGYGQAFSDTVTLSDQILVSSGLLLSDTQALTDAMVLVFGLTEVLSDTQTLSDFVRFGFGFAETLTLSDLAIIQYGYRFSDLLTLSDGFAFVAGANQFTDTLTLSDALLLGFGYLPTETLVISDPSFTEILQFQLVIAGSINNWLDDEVVQLGVLLTIVVADTMSLSDTAFVQGTLMTEVLSDTMTMSDILSSGFTERLTDTMTVVDAAMVITFQRQLAIACPHLNNWQDTYAQSMGAPFQALTYSFAEQLLLVDVENLLIKGPTIKLQLVDGLTLTDQPRIGHRDAFVETITLTDAFSFGFGGSAQSRALSDTMTMSEGVRIFVPFDIPAEVMTMVDAVVVNLTSSSSGRSLSDQLRMSDRLSVVDPFSGASLGSNWTINQGTFVESGGSLGVTAGGGNGRSNAWWNANVFDDDQSVQVTVTGLGTTTGALGPAVRMGASGQTYYGFYASTTTWSLIAMVAGSLTPLASGAWTSQVGDVLILTVQGSLLTAKINETVVSTVIDSLITTGQPGVASFGASPNTNTIDNWIAIGAGAAFKIGLGYRLTETLLLSDQLTFFTGLRFAQQLSDILALSDALTTLASSFGAFQFTDAMDIEDTVDIYMPYDIPAEVMALSDVLAIEYGDQLVDQLTQTDLLVYGISGPSTELIADVLALSDQLRTFMPYAMPLADALPGLVDRFLVGYFETLADTQTLVDVYTQTLTSSTLTISDTMLIVDSISTAGLAAFTDGFVELFAQADELATFMPYSMPYTEALTLSEAFVLGTGIPLADVLVAMTDAIQLFQHLAPIETLTLSDALAIGRGLSFTDQLTMVDSDILRSGEQLVDQLTLIDDFFYALVSTIIPIQVIEQLVITDQYIGVMQEMEVFSDTMTLSDAISINSEKDLLFNETLREASYNFANRPDQDPLDPRTWSTYVAALYTPLQLVGGTCQAEAVGSAAALYTAVPIQNDQSSRIIIGAIGSSDRIRAFVRATSAGYYVVICQGSSLTPTVILQRVVLPSSLTTLGTPFNGTINPGDIVEIKVQGTNLSVILNGATIITASDATFASGAPGIGINANVSLPATTILSWSSPQAIAGDQLRLGYGDVITDQLVAIQDAFAALGGGLLTTFADAMTTLSDTDRLLEMQLIGLSDTITLSDQIRFANVLLLSDQLTLTDALSFFFPIGFSIGETLSLVDTTGLGIGLITADTETITDALGFGAQLSDTLTQTDALSVGYGNLVTDQLTITDSISLLFPIGLVIGESISLSDQLLSGIGLAITDTETLTEAIGSGFPLTDILTQTDSILVGSGLALTDQLVLVDVISFYFPIGLAIGEAFSLSDSIVLGVGVSFADTQTLSDALGFSISLADTITLTDIISGMGYGNRVADQLTLTDALQFLFTGAQLSDQMTLVDSPGLGIGYLLTDTITLTEGVKVFVPLNIPAETMTLSDAVLVGYGDQFRETLTQTDAFASLVSNAPKSEQLSDALTQTDQFGIFVTGTTFEIVQSDNLAETDFVRMGIGSQPTDQLTLADDNQGLGYGDAVTDQLTLADQLDFVGGIFESLSDTASLSDRIQLEYGDALVDTMVQSDFQSLGVGSQLADSQTLTDDIDIGYGNAVTDTQTLTDAISVSKDSALADTVTLTDSMAFIWVYPLVLADTLILSDAIRLGAVNQMFDQLILVDSLAIRYGNIIADTQTLTDAVSISKDSTLADTVTLTDAMSFLWNYPLGLSDTLTQTDAIRISIGNQLADQLVLSEDIDIGYGNAVTDVQTLTDTASVSKNSGLTDTITLTDAMVFQWIYPEILADTLTQVEAVRMGISYLPAETLPLTDGPIISYGYRHSDAMTLSDAAVVSLNLPNLLVTVQDQITQADVVQAGYGSGIADTGAINDQMDLLENFQLALADAPPGMLEILGTLFAAGIDINDAMLFQEQLVILYGLLIDDGITQLDQLDESLIAPAELLLEDDASAEWFDAILLMFVFSPGEIIMASLKIMGEMVVQEITVRGLMRAGDITVEEEGVVEGIVR